MGALFKYQLLRAGRNGMILIWALIFPILLTLMFMAMFADLGKEVEIGPKPFGLVKDSSWSSAPGLDQILSAFSDPKSEYYFADFTDYPDPEEADAAARAGTTIGFVSVEDGVPVLHVTSEGNASVTSVALRRALDVYTQTTAQQMTLVKGGAGPAALAALQARETFTRDVSSDFTRSSATARYFFALLGFTAGMGLMIPMRAIKDLMASGGPIGARSTLSRLPRWQVLMASLASSWVAMTMCGGLVFVFIRFVAKIDFGPNGMLALVAIACSALMACGAGALLGTIPRLPPPVASAIITPLALFTGLYGPASTRLADLVETKAPILSWLNPLWQSTHAFYGLLYYDVLAPFIINCSALVAMGAVFLSLALVRMRRMSHEHL